MKRPNRMRWEYTQPTAKLFVLDGRRTYFYVPRDNQVAVAAWQGSTEFTPLLFLVGRGDLKRDFLIERADDDPKLAAGDTVLRLVPRIEQAQFKEVLIEVRQTEAEILRLSVLEHGGNRNDYLFRRPQANTALPDALFRFKVPPGAEVLQAEK